MSDLFRFKMRATECDPSGYYYPRWDRAKTITVVAPTQRDAIDRADTVLGTTTHRGWHWVFKVGEITDHAIPLGATDE